jgi:NAD(P)-dependent dehydrogenase (short-subunit alcohol dehydrogenase family)
MALASPSPNALDEREYAAICAHLGLQPDPRLFGRLAAYLGSIRPAGRVRTFAAVLAEPRLTRFRVARLDLASKLFFPGHPVREALNAVLALHECHGGSYRRMAAAPTGARAMLAIIGGVVAFALSLAVTIPWLAGQYVAYRLRSPGQGTEDLTGTTVLITGVNRGLGRDLMEHCLARGAAVIGTVRTQATLEELVAQLTAQTPEAPRPTLVVADLAAAGALPAALRAARVDPHGIDVAILSAGVKHAGKSVLSQPELRETFQVNLFSAAEFAGWFLGPGGALPSEEVARPRHGLRERTLAVVSSMGRWHGMHLSSGYNASKAALSIWAESLEMEAAQQARDRLRVLIVEPGLFDSGMSRRSSLTRLLSAPRQDVARQIVSAALSGRRSLRPPFWFALLTWGVCLGGRGLRARLFARTTR